MVRYTVKIIMIQLEPSWKNHLEAEFDLPYMVELKKFLLQEAQRKKIIYPPGREIFNALNLTPFENVKVVILGQDPYHGIGQAHGLCFSVREGVRPPPSLINIFKELKDDMNIDPPKHGCLENWSRQGVLLLNNVLTVEHGKAASHHGQGWEFFTDKIIEKLNQEKEHLVFILWGSPAQKKAKNVDTKKHLILFSPHPSPLSSYRGFFGSKPFSKTNKYLEKHGIKPINWKV
jgi:uracil-DNA glycosylase